MLQTIKCTYQNVVAIKHPNRLQKSKINPAVWLPVVRSDTDQREVAWPFQEKLRLMSPHHLPKKDTWSWHLKPGCEMTWTTHQTVNMRQGQAKSPPVSGAKSGGKSQFCSAIQNMNTPASADGRKRWMLIQENLRNSETVSILWQWNLYFNT